MKHHFERKKGWKDGRMEGRKEGYIPSFTTIRGLWFPAGTLTIVGIPPARKKKCFYYIVSIFTFCIKSVLQ